MVVSIDVHRIEERFFILSKYLEPFLSDVSQILVRRVFSEKKVSRTIYFNNDDCPVPWGYSLKARQYFPDFSSVISISPNDIYKVEIKGRKEGNVRDKIQRNLPIGEAIRFINEQLNTQMPDIVLRPYAADEYQRVHFISRENERMLRLTVDWNTRYAYFEEGSPEAIWTGNDDFIRVELKVSPEYGGSEEHNKVLEVIAKYSAVPVISKRSRAFNLASVFLDKKGSRMKKEIHEREIEAKFLVHHPNPAILFLALKKHLQGGHPYRVCPHYAYTKEEGGINYYWARRDYQQQIVEGLKIRFLGQLIKPVFKKSTSIIPDHFGLNCVLEREEVKGQAINFTQEAYNEIIRRAERDLGSLEFIGYLVRSRRAFWPENKVTGRVYHISIDECRSFDGRVIYQMEVEYTGRYLDRSSNESETELKQAIREEVTELSQEVLVFCNRSEQYLTPTTLTKFDWLRKKS